MAKHAPELTVLALAALLQAVQIVLAGAVMNGDVGVAYNAGPRDATPEFSPLTGRLRRAVSNHFEALGLFTIAVVVVTLSGKAGGLTAACAWIYLAARILYVPAYAFGWTPWRSAIFGVGATATMVMLSSLFWGRDMTSFDRIKQNWVYGGALAGLLLLALAPLVVAGWDRAAALGFLLLPVYMLHQFEEHDDDRFRRFANRELGHGREILSVSAVFWINILGVRALMAASVWLTRIEGAGWAALAGWLVTINGLLHLGQGVALRRYNPGLVTAILLFLPLGGLDACGRLAGRDPLQWWGAFAIAAAVHVAIVLHVRSRLKPAPGGAFDIREGDDLAEYDVIVIGAGPGGYVCAIRAAQLGLKTACVEGRETLGGTCLNVGCIPSKAMLHASELYHEAHESFPKMGIIGAAPTIDVAKLQGYKQSTVDGNTKGIEFLFKKNKIDWLKGWATIPAPGEVKVGEETHRAKNIVIASGSVPSSLPGVEVDEATVVTSTGALVLPSIPKTMTVIGAGVIGLELGSVYARLGTAVTVVEYLDQITPGMDLDICKALQKVLTKQGLKFVLGAAVQGVEPSEGGPEVVYKLRKDDSEHRLKSDVVLVATGRKPYTDGLGLEALKVQMSKRGQIEIDAHWRTSVPGIYAIGDAVSGPMLAHKAEDEGMAAAETIAGKHGHVNYDVIPGVIYTTPEVASVGETEETLKGQGRAYKVGKFPFMGNARARALLQSEGFVKILADKETDRILGAHIIGPQAGEMIHEICVAMEFGASAEDVARTCHAHPTCSEAVREAALACGDGAIHV